MPASCVSICPMCFVLHFKSIELTVTATVGLFHSNRLFFFRHSPFKCDYCFLSHHSSLRLNFSSFLCVALCLFTKLFRGYHTGPFNTRMTELGLFFGFSFTARGRTLHLKSTNRFEVQDKQLTCFLLPLQHRRTGAGCGSRPFSFCFSLSGQGCQYQYKSVLITTYICIDKDKDHMDHSSHARI